MELERLDADLTVCKVASLGEATPKGGLFFLAVTDNEISVVCETRHTPKQTTERTDGWRGLRVSGTMDFSLVGVLARLSGTLAEESIPLFCVSTFDTDYLLVRTPDFERACETLHKAGHTIR